MSNWHVLTQPDLTVCYPYIYNLDSEHNSSIKGLSIGQLKLCLGFKIQAYARTENTQAKIGFFIQPQKCKLWRGLAKLQPSVLFSSKAWCSELPVMFLFCLLLRECSSTCMSSFSGRLEKWSKRESGIPWLQKSIPGTRPSTQTVSSCVEVEFATSVLFSSTKACLPKIIILFQSLA